MRRYGSICSSSRTAWASIMHARLHLTTSWMLKVSISVCFEKSFCEEKYGFYFCRLEMCFKANSSEPWIVIFLEISGPIAPAQSGVTFWDKRGSAVGLQANEATCVKHWTRRIDLQLKPDCPGRNYGCDCIWRQAECLRFQFQFALKKVFVRKSMGSIFVDLKCVSKSIPVSHGL